ncbi:hypothetical protein IGI96_002917 [Enterococcus sp. DIV0421]|uniref:EF0163 family protein n=1 Tax=Enterococcus sp. DIV0421 TaxID=2774688 RepID=UPI003F23F56A
MKKGIVVVLSCICLVGLTGCHCFFFEEQATQMTEETIEAAEESESERQISSLEQPMQQINDVTKSFLKDFARKWSNFTDVYQRNQAVREYMTDRCIKDNSIDVDPHVQVETTGRIYQMTQDIEQFNQYLLFGEETMNGVTRLIVLQVKVVPNEQKIDEFHVYYVRSAY